MENVTNADNINNKDKEILETVEKIIKLKGAFVKMDKIFEMAMMRLYGEEHVEEKLKEEIKLKM